MSHYSSANLMFFGLFFLSPLASTETDTGEVHMVLLSALSARFPGKSTLHRNAAQASPSQTRPTWRVRPIRPRPRLARILMIVPTTTACQHPPIVRLVQTELEVPPYYGRDG